MSSPTSGTAVSATSAPGAVRDRRTAASQPGARVKLELPIARLMSGTPVALPVMVVHGRGDGPTMWLSAAIHGDETLWGRDHSSGDRVRVDPRTLAGTVIAVPVVNVHGFNTGDRFLPDRRDLNRSFPGSARGSLAGTDRAPDDDRDRGPQLDRNRSAHRIGPPDQPAADPRETSRIRPYWPWPRSSRPRSACMPGHVTVLCAPRPPLRVPPCCCSRGVRPTGSTSRPSSPAPRASCA